MRYIIHDPIITENSIEINAEIDGYPDRAISVTETGISKDKIEQRLIRNIEIIAMKIARHKLGQIEW